MTRLLPRFVSVCLALTLTGAMAADGVTKNQLLIGQNITLQGGKNDYGTAVQDGIQAYLNGVNARGGVNGRQIVLKTLDDDNKGAQAEANARQLVEQDKVFILFGSIEGGPSTAVMKAAIDLKVPFFGPIAGSPTLRRPHQPLVFPVRAEHREEFRALIRYGVSTGLKRVGFLHADSDTGRQHLENVRLAATEFGAEFGAGEPFKSDISDEQLGALLRRFEAARVDMLLNHGSAPIYTRLIRLARQAGSRITFMAVNSGSTQIAAALRELAQGMVFTQVMPSPWARKTAITREYQEAFGQAHPGREFSYGSLEGYMTAKALVMALKLAGPQPTRERFVKGLEGVNFDLGGIAAAYSASSHTGSTYVDLAMVTREGKFLQ